MKHRTITPSLVYAALMFTAIESQAVEVVSPDSIADKVTVQNLRQEGETVRAEIVNQTSHRLADVQLLVAYNWLWRNEFNPGPESPSWATTMVLEEPLGPNEVREFTFDPQQPPTDFAEGNFRPTVKVVGFTEYSRPDVQ